MTKKTSLTILSIIATVVLSLFFTSCEKPGNEPQPGAPLEGVTLSPETLQMTVGETRTLSLNLQPQGASYLMVEWTSTHTSVATVNALGQVEAHSAGNAQITVNVDGFTASALVTVTGTGTTPTPDPDPVVPGAAPKIGDYYYSDGTWSTARSASKQVIGIVYWVGDVTADDPLLKADHPGCTNGLVMSIDEECGFAWQENYYSYGKTVQSWLTQNYMGVYQSIELNSYSSERMLKRGYNNTKAIEAFNASSVNSAWMCDVIEMCKEYREYHPAPSGTSDWYVPSLMEVALMSGSYITSLPEGGPVTDNSTWHAVNTKLSSVPGAMQLGPNSVNQYGFYTTSNEVFGGPEKGWAVAFNTSYSSYGYISAYTKTSTLYASRYVLAF